MNGIASLTEAISCPLCSAVGTATDSFVSSDSPAAQAAKLFSCDKQRAYYCCERCQLISIAPCQRLDWGAQKAIYDLHQNSSDDPGYRRFLSRLANPLLELASPDWRILDFGCGPGPTLSVMLEEQGLKVALYDPIYHNKPELLTASYDCITASEVFEHLAHPGAEIKHLVNRLNKGAYLCVMTKLWRDKAAFQHWHYKNDPTHISFYHRDTFEFIAEQWSMTVTYPASDVIFLQRK